MMVPISILGVARKDPFDWRTFSGSAACLFTALRQQGSLHDAISARPTRLVEALHKGLNLHPHRQRWKFQYDLGVDLRRERTRVALRQIERLDGPFNVICQIGSWFDLTRRPGKLTISYQDGNLSTLLNSPYRYPRVRPAFLRRVHAYERQVYGKLDAIFPMSRWLAESFIRDFGVSPKRIAPPIGAGINLPYLKEVPHKLYDRPHALFVGKQFERKGGRALLEAFRAVRKEISEATLTIVGSQVTDLPDGVRCAGLLSKNTPEGLERLLEEYARASLFVMPSLHEPYGVVFAEAMAHRLPCIGTAICAMPEIIDDGLTGFVVPPNDSRALAQRMVELFKDPARCHAMGERAYAKYLAHHTWDRVAQKMVEHLKALV